jgi:anthranilate/para-aminobenzoate synthase component II
MYTSSLENCKSITIIKVVSTNKRELPLLFVICLGKQIIELVLGARYDLPRYI